MRRCILGLLVLLWGLCLPLYAEKTKIAFIGNSITVQNGPTDSYPGQLATFLGEDDEVGNFGVSGRTMLRSGDYPIWNEPQFAQALAFKPHILFILLGTNDSKPWNWDEHKDEFLVDYNAMIDTFLQANPPPKEIWACLPPPAFSVQWGIRDSVITADIIPRIRQLVADRNLKSIDFYTPFIHRRDLFPDDIHPNVEGSEAMALLIYEALTGRTIQRHKDINLCKGGQAFSQGLPVEALIDGNPRTAWPLTQLPFSAMVDLGRIDTVDACVLHFPDSRTAGLRYTLEGSIDNQTWIPLVDHSNRNDTEAPAQADTLRPTAVRYLRLTLTGAVNMETEYLIGELQAFKARCGHHAPVLTPWVERVSSRFVAYQITITPITRGREKFKLYRGTERQGPFAPSTGFKDITYTQYKLSLRPGQTFYLFTRSFLNGEFVLSDTVRIYEPETSVRPAYPEKHPLRIDLEPNYPNPFNPETTIRFYLAFPGKATLAVYDLAGRRVRTLVEGSLLAGQHTARWDGRDRRGARVASGLYSLVLRVENPDGRVDTVRRKITLMK